MGPARAFEEREKFKQKYTFSLSNTCFSKIVVFDLQATLFDGKNNVLQVSGRNMLENAYKITSTSKFSSQNVQIPYTLHPALSYSPHSIAVGRGCRARDTPKNMMLVNLITFFENFKKEGSIR